MTIFETLKNEHDKHRTLIDLVEKTEGDSEGRRELFSKLATELRAHADAEERTLYAEMLSDAESQPKASHSVHEHEEIDELIKELLETDLSSSGWIATFKKLAEQTRHHMDEEENETFAAGRKVMSDSKAEELARKFEEEKAKEVEAQKVDLTS